ncbi:MAG: tetratricopeptide repeat protein, partial [Gammaproteobacteria bacterium]|nr:tetratricopeptide repeat protein [Gammaproteobacteria bacterium]
MSILGGNGVGSTTSRLAQGLRGPGLLAVVGLCLTWPGAVGATNQAETWLATARYEQAIEAANQTLDAGAAEHDPATLATAQRVLGLAFEATGRYTQALQHLARASELRGATDEQSDTERRNDTAEGSARTAPAATAASLDLQAELGRARIELLLGRRDVARSRLDQVLQAHRLRAGSLTAAELIAVAQAYAWFARSDPALYPLVLERLEEAIEHAPRDPSTHVAMGDLLLDRYNNAEARNAFATALELDPDNLHALLGMARSQRFDHSPQAQQTAQRCLELNPGFLPAHLLLAELLMDSEQYDAASNHVEAALQTNPSSPHAHALAAAMLYLRAELTEFDERVARIKQETPGYVDLYEILAQVASQNRRYPDAIVFAASAVKQDATAWRARQLLGLNQLRVGRMSEGRASLEAAFAGDPYNVRTRNTLELLDQLARFESQRSEHFELVAMPGEIGVLAPRLLPIAEQAYAFYKERYGIEPETPIRIEVYPDHEDFSVRTIGLVGIDILGVSFGPVIALDSPSAGVFGPFNWASALWHEIAHTFHIALTRGRVPRWFSEGLAVFEEHRARPGWGTDVSPGFLRAFQRGMLAPAADLNQAFLRPTYPEQIPHAYFQAALLMQLIEREHGFDTVVRMLRAYADGEDDAKVLERELGLSAQALNERFDAFVRERFGDSLAGLVSTEPATGPATGPSDPDAPSTPHADRPETGYTRLLADAARALEAGDDATALRLAEQARALFPAHGGPGSAYRLLARIHAAAGRNGAAIEALRQSIAIDADDIEGHLELAAHLERDGHPDAVIDVLERAMLIQPFDGEQHARLAELHEAAGRWLQASQARRAVVDLGPRDPAGARYRLARALYRDAQEEPARLALLDALEQAPMYDEALELLLGIVRP